MNLMKITKWTYVIIEPLTLQAWARFISEICQFKTTPMVWYYLSKLPNIQLTNNYIVTSLVTPIYTLSFHNSIPNNSYSAIIAS